MTTVQRQLCSLDGGVSTQTEWVESRGSLSVLTAIPTQCHVILFSFRTSLEISVFDYVISEFLDDFAVTVYVCVLNSNVTNA